MTILETFEAFFQAATVDRDAAALDDLWLAGDATITMWGSDLAEKAEGSDAVRALGRAITTSTHELRFHWREVAVHERGEVAWVNAHGHVSADGEDHPYRVTCVFLRTYAGWRMHTFNGSIPD